MWKYRDGFIGHGAFRDSGSLFGGPQSKDYSALGSSLGVLPMFGNYHFSSGYGALETVG